MGHSVRSRLQGRRKAPWARWPNEAINPDRTIRLQASTWGPTAGRGGREDVGMPPRDSARVLQSRRPSRTSATPCRALRTVPASTTPTARRPAGRDRRRRVRIINEPPPPCSGVRAGQRVNGPHILVFDLGGGIFDVAEIGEGGSQGQGHVRRAPTWGTTGTRKVIEWLVTESRRIRSPRQGPDGAAAGQGGCGEGQIESSLVRNRDHSLPFITRQRQADFTCSAS